MQSLAGEYTCANCGKTYNVFQLYCSSCGCVMLDALQDEGEITQLLPPGNQAAPVDVAWGTRYFHDLAQLQLRIEETGQTILARRNNWPALIGRSIASYRPHVTIPDALAIATGVSRVHARVDRLRTSLHVTDLYSTNGTFLDGQQLRPQVAHLLHNGAVLQLGSLVLRVEFL